MNFAINPPINNAQLINQTSGDVEYYTDPKIVEAARSVLGDIDLDPASSVKANEVIKAKKFFGYTEDGFVDGLKQEWRGRIWLNHPFGRAEEACTADCQKHIENPKHKHHTIDYHGNQAWIDYLMAEVLNHHLEEGLCITYAATSEAWFQPLLRFPNCFLSPRTNYYLPDGTLKKGVTKGSVVTLLGGDLKKFNRLFRPFGEIKIRYQ